MAIDINNAILQSILRMNASQPIDNTYLLNEALGTAMGIPISENNPLFMPTFNRSPVRGLPQNFAPSQTIAPVEEDESIPQGSQYGLRPDETAKGTGFFGPLKGPSGDISTELSIGVNFDGKETLIPSLVPTLNKEEVDYLLRGGKATKEIVDKAVNFARFRISQGLSPFAGNEEIPHGIKLP